MNPNDEFDQIRDDVACGIIPPPPGFERYADPDVEVKKEFAKVVRSMTSSGRMEEAWAALTERREEEH